MSKIPKDVLEAILADKFYKFCCIPHFEFPCSGRVEFHHNLIYGGRQVQEKDFILPVCTLHHAKEKSKSIKDRLNWVMLKRGSQRLIEAYSKSTNWAFEQQRLNKLYG